MKQLYAFGFESGLDDVEEDEVEPARRVPVKMPNPKRPSREDVDEHNLTHLPFCNWCEQCARGKGRAADHKQACREDGEPAFHLDH